MKNANEAIAYGIETSQRMVNQYTADLKGDEWLHRPCPKANCAAWIIGHLIMSDRRMLTTLGVTDLPALPTGFEKRFSRDADAPGAAEFGDTSILIPLFDRHRTMLAERVRTMETEVLNKPLEKPHPRFQTPGEMAAFMSIHAMMHGGQITYIRRSLGRPPLI